MLRYITRRVALMVPVVLGTTFILYAAVYALPGDPVQALVGPNQAVSPSFERAMRERYHLDEPLLEQYWYYLSGLLHGDLGVGLNGTPVAAITAASWPVTLKLALTTWVLEAFFAVVLGTWAAVRKGRTGDMAVLGGTTLMLGVPYFVVAYAAQIGLGLKLGWFPVSGTAEGWPLSYLLPALMLALVGIPTGARLTRASVLENLQADYVDTAVAKGVPPRLVVVRHVLRNSLIPVVSLLGLSLGYLLSGTVLIEGIFNLPGLGYQIFQGIRMQNAPVVVGISTLLVLVFLVVNLLVDILYGVLDPRIRHE